jgi:hypothetical protein
VAGFEGELGDAEFVELAEAFSDHAFVLFLRRASPTTPIPSTDHLTEGVTAEHDLSAGGIWRRFETTTWRSPSRA